MWNEFPKEWNEIATQGNPRFSGDYLIFTNEKYQYVASWSKIWETKDLWRWEIRCECSNAEDSMLTDDMVTHWMDLPSDPFKDT